MVEEYFGFSGPPFKLSPDTKFFFSSKSHTKAMAYLHYGLRQAEGFIVITGEIGAGKSMLVGHMLDQVNRENLSAAHLVTSSVEPEDLIAHVLSTFQLEAAGTGRSAELEAFEDFLYDNYNRGRRVLLVVDEAQNLPSRTIEELRMLTNINHQGKPLFQVFLIGQPEFRDTLARSDMEQLRQRVIASYHLQPLDNEETREYIDHRLAVVGRKDKPVFTEEAFDAIYEYTDGVPRRVNTLATRILLFCALEERDLINSAVVKAVAAELDIEVMGPDNVAPLPPAAPISTVTSSYENYQQEEHLYYDEEDEGPQFIAPHHEASLPPKLAHEGVEGGDNRNPEAATLTDVATAIAEITPELPDSTPQETTPSPAKQGQAMSYATEGELSASNNISNGDSSGDNERAYEKGLKVHSVMDHIQSLRNDLRAAHQGNRKIYQSIVQIEDAQADNVIEIQRHLSRARTILTDMNRKN